MMIDPLWTQTIAYEVNTACSAMQRIASAWRDNPKRDPMRVVETARSVARTLVALADQIEAKRNAALRLDAITAMAKQHGFKIKDLL